MIRPAEISDAAQIAAIYNGYVAASDATFDTEPVSAPDFAERIREISAHCPFYVFDDCGKVVGYCYAHAWKQKAAYARTLETTVYVAPDSVGRGIGEALVRALVEECRRRGVRALVACITAGNAPSVRLHEKLGFVKVSHFRSVGEKFGRMLDVEDFELLL